MTSPYFSVVVPAYNVGAYIEETVESVLNQTYSNLELIVINDGSTDDTADKLLLFQDPRFSVYHIKNQGVSHARNVGISHAKGKYIAFLDGDDLWESSHLHYAAEFFIKNPDVMWWTSQAYVAGAPRKFNMPIDAQTEIFHYYGIPSLYANSSSLILNAEAAKEMFPLFPESMVYAEDWAAWASFAEKHPLIGFCPMKDVLYRSRSGSATKTKPISQLMDRFLGLPRHMSYLLNSGDTSDLSRRYFRFRSTERWWDFFSIFIMPGWKEELQKHKKVLGRFYYVIKIQAFVLSLFARTICKTLSVIGSIQARNIARTR